MLCCSVRMAQPSASAANLARLAAVLALVLLGRGVALATDWPQYRGPATDGSSPDAIATTWATNSPTFVVWRNTSLTNGFSSFAVSQGRAFAMISRVDRNGNLQECCAAVDATTGLNLWTTPIDIAPWNPASTADGGDGTAPYNSGDGPRTTPSVSGGRVFALSGLLHLVGLNATNGSVLWSNDLVSAYGATTIPWENAASPCLDDDLLFVNLNSSANNQNLAAFHTADGSLAWSSQDENVTHTTPVIATIQGVRQVIFATQTGLVSLDRTTGALLWKGQHPDVETYYGSKHQKAGVECSSCHMPKVKDPKTGKTFTSHWQTSPRHYVKETCLTCHSQWNEKQVNYVIDSLKNRYDGKVRKAEFWLTRMVDKFEEAQNLGVDNALLNDVRKKHDEAHIHWEWWTAVNGAYFHNPDQATDSLNKSMAASQEGIKMLDDAMAKVRAARQAVAASPPVAAK